MKFLLLLIIIALSLFTIPSIVHAELITFHSPPAVTVLNDFGGNPSICSDVQPSGSSVSSDPANIIAISINSPIATCSSIIYEFDVTDSPTDDFVITSAIISGLRTEYYQASYLPFCNAGFNTLPFQDSLKFETISYNYYQNNYLNTFSSLSQCANIGTWDNLDISSNHFTSLKNLIDTENKIYFVLGANQNQTVSPDILLTPINNSLEPTGYSPVQLTLNYAPSYPSPDPVIISGDGHGSSITLSWQKPNTFGAEVIRYQINYTDSGTDPNLILNDNFVTNDQNITYDISGLSPFVDYYFRVGIETEGGFNPNGNKIFYGLAMTPPPVTTLRTNSFNPTEIDLIWNAPQTGFPITGYQINFTYPFGTPLTVLAHNTGNNETSFTITNLDVDREYSFRIGVFTATGFNPDGNIVDTTTLSPLSIGNITLNAINTDKIELIFSRTDSTDSSTVIIDYDPSIALNCQYDTVFKPVRQNFTLNPVLIDDRLVSSIIFQNNSDSIINIYCMDSNSDQTWNYIIPQQFFPFLQQIQNFRSGEYGTTGMFGAIDLVTLSVIIISMIGFNRVNESVGIILTTCFIGLSLFFGLITIPSAFIPVIALVLMVVITSTRKT